MAHRDGGACAEKRVMLYVFLSYIGLSATGEIKKICLTFSSYS